MVIQNSLQFTKEDKINKGQGLNIGTLCYIIYLLMP